MARIGLLPDDVLVAVLSSLAGLSGGRLIAGLGTGDHLSRAENEAYGVPFEPADERRARLAAVAAAVPAPGHPGVGRGRPARRRWSWPGPWARPSTSGRATPVRVAELTAAGMEVTWGGPVGETVGEATARLGELAAAGATWAVCAWPDSLEVVAEAAERSGPPVSRPTSAVGSGAGCPGRAGVRR